jgi:hypothetical protein
VAGQAKYTKAYKRLRKNLERGKTLLHEFFDLPGGSPRTAGQPRSHEQELLRSVLVLGIGALDAYLSELTTELVPKLARGGTAFTIFDRLMKDQGGLILQAIYLGSNDLERALADAVESYLAGSVMHGSKAVMQVNGWCALTLGATDFNGGRFSSAFKSLDSWTDKRHRIVHRGELVKMKRSDATDVLELVDHIGGVLNRRALKQYP